MTAGVPSLQQAGQVPPPMQTPDPGSFLANLLANAPVTHSVHITHASIHPAHKAKHGALMKGHHSRKGHSSHSAHGKEKKHG